MKRSGKIWKVRGMVIKGVLKRLEVGKNPNLKIGKNSYADFQPSDPPTRLFFLYLLGFPANFPIYNNVIMFHFLH